MADPVGPLTGDEHDPLCRYNGTPLDNGAPDRLPERVRPYCWECQQIAKVRADERERIADRIRAVSHYKYIDTDGLPSTKVHMEYKGLGIAEALIRMDLTTEEALDRETPFPIKWGEDGLPHLRDEGV